MDKVKFETLTQGNYFSMDGTDLYICTQWQEDADGETINAVNIYTGQLAWLSPKVYVIPMDAEIVYSVKES